ncbi:MAG: site-specific integrase [Ktedonobacteraceae bacterium]|nr:site-specific integrase [Ktedonobacteraceae bacterium]
MAKSDHSKHGEGSVFKRKDGRYVAQVTLENRKKKQTYHKSEKEANAALRKMLHELEQGTLATGPQQTLKVYLDNWLEQVHKHSVRESTYGNYRTVLDVHLIPALGHIPLQKLKPQQVQAMYAAKLEEGLSSGRVRSIHMVLYMALSQAVRWNLVARNVCELVKLPAYKPVRKVQALTLDQAKHLMQVAKEHKLDALITLAVITGLRRGELLGLHWSDIDLNKRTLTVSRSVGRYFDGRKGVVVSEPKTENSKRQIMLPAIALDALKRQQELQKTMQEHAGASWTEKGIVFSDPHGDYIHPNTLVDGFKRLLRSADLPVIRFHDLRHSAATILISLGVNAKVIQQLLGHSDISITLGIYGHVLPSMLDQAVDVIDNAYGEQT